MTALITAEQLRGLSILLRPDTAAIHAAALTPALAEWDIDTPREIAIFMAQIAHESCGFTRLKEMGGPAYFRRYEGRRDLGNIYPGDGARFPGRGYIQITGRDNHRAAEKAIGIPLISNPELAEIPEHAARIAGWFWASRGMGPMAENLQFERITRRINGGINGIKDRRRYWELAKKIWQEG